jgi:hypothetical protein
MENLDLKTCERQLGVVQNKYRLPDIFIVSDRPDSFRAFCSRAVPRKQMLHILTDPALENIDANFIHWTAVRGEATAQGLLQSWASTSESCGYPLQL